MVAVVAGAGWSQILAADSSTGATGKPSGSVLHLNRLKVEASQPWNQFFQNSLNLTPGGDYTLTFWARASAPTKLTASTKVSQPPWNPFGLREDVQLTSEWQLFTLKFKADGAVPEHSRLMFSFSASKIGEVWLADLFMKPAQASADPDVTHLIANAQFIDGLDQWYVEGKLPGVYEAEVQSMADANAAPKK